MRSPSWEMDSASRMEAFVAVMLHRCHNPLIVCHDFVFAANQQDFVLSSSLQKQCWLGKDCKGFVVTFYFSVLWNAIMRMLFETCVGECVNASKLIG